MNVIRKMPRFSLTRRELPDLRESSSRNQSLPWRPGYRDPEAAFSTGGVAAVAEAQIALCDHAPAKATACVAALCAAKPASMNSVPRVWWPRPHNASAAPPGTTKTGGTRSQSPSGGSLTRSSPQRPSPYSRPPHPAAPHDCEILVKEVERLASPNIYMSEEQLPLLKQLLDSELVHGSTRPSGPNPRSRCSSPPTRCPSPRTKVLKIGSQRPAAKYPGRVCEALGLLNFHRHFIPHDSDICSPRNALASLALPWSWSKSRLLAMYCSAVSISSCFWMGNADHPGNRCLRRREASPQVFLAPQKNCDIPRQGAVHDRLRVSHLSPRPVAVAISSLRLPDRVPERRGGFHCRLPHALPTGCVRPGRELYMPPANRDKFRNLLQRDATW